MIQVGERRVFMRDRIPVQKGMEFIVHSVLVHIDTGHTYVGCEFFEPVRYGHNLAITTVGEYSGYTGTCTEEHGSYFSVDDIKTMTELLTPIEPDWEV